MKKITKLKTQVMCNRSMFIAYCFLLAAFYLLPTTLSAQKQQKSEVQKVFTKNLQVNAKDHLKISTTFTKITFQEWDRNEIDFTTTFTTAQKDMERLLKCLDINYRQSLKTTVCDINFKLNKGKENKFDITLLVKVPKDIFLTISSTFGDVEIANVYNDFNATIQFGDLDVENLFGKNNSINIQFGDLNVANLVGTNKIEIQHGDFTIGEVPNLSLSAEFSDGTINEVGTLKLESQFSTIKINTVQFVNITSQNDKLSISNTLDKIEGTMEFGTLKINSLKSSCILKNISFSDINIYEVLPSFQTIDCFSSHSTIMFLIPRDQSFALDYAASFSKFKNNNLKLTNAVFQSEDNSVQMQGIYGSNLNTNKIVKIRANFGTVSLFK